MVSAPEDPRWLVDGFNLIGARPDGWWRDRPRAMRDLVRRLGAYAAATGEAVTVVFDGRPSGVPAGIGEQVRVVFASRSGRGAADDEIVELVAADAVSETLTVVTSDAELATRVGAHGASVVSSGSFRRRLDRLEARRGHDTPGLPARPPRNES